MLKNLILILLVAFPLSMMAQNDDPFGGGSSGGDDPFGSGGSTSDDPFGGGSSNDAPAETIPSTPQPQPPTSSEPTNPPSSSTDPFGSGTTNGSDSNTFGDSSSDLGVSGGAGNGLSGGDPFENMVDTLTEPLVPDFPWEQRAIKEKPLLNYYDTDETDVFWAKTVYREIDIREKMNHTFAYPRAPFMTILLDVLSKNPEIKVYKEDTFTGKEFSETSSWGDIEADLGNEREVEVFDLDDQGNEITLTETIIDKFRASKVKRFKVKEVWFFDKKESRMKVRIMGIAPLMERSATDYGADAVMVQQLGLTNSTIQETLFWVYYPDIRENLARYQTFNPMNDALRMSWDDLLSARYFSSYITKASNPLDRKIADYTRNGLEALWESERIKEEIFNFEQDLWTY